MTFHSVSTMEKPLMHLDLNDWNCRVLQLGRTADVLRKDAFDLRQSSQKLRNESRIDSEWTAIDTNTELQDRIGELQRWRETITRTYERILKEADTLAREKELTEREIDTLKKPIAILSECLTMRDCRLGSELTYDEADLEIKNELTVLENNQSLLIQRCQKAWEKLNRLGDVKYKIFLEINNKKEAEQCDEAQLQLDRNTASNTFKLDATRTPKNSLTYNEWMEHTRSMKQMAENELADTFAVREVLFVCRMKARNLLKAQQDRTDYAIRKRIFETQRAVNELGWQQKKMREELDKSACEIKALEETIHEKNDSLKLVQTRLENRAQRSGQELCLDFAHQSMVIETRKLERILRHLEDKLHNAQVSFNQLARHTECVGIDLDNKKHSLETDTRALHLRDGLKASGEEAAKFSQTDRNIILTNTVDVEKQTMASAER